MVGLYVTRFGFESLSIVENHQGSGFGRIVLGGYIDPVSVLSPRIDLAWQSERSVKMSFRHAVQRSGIGSEFVVCVHLGVATPGRRGAVCLLAQGTGQDQQRQQKEKILGRMKGLHSQNMPTRWIRFKGKVAIEDGSNHRPVTRG